MNYLNMALDLIITKIHLISVELMQQNSMFKSLGCKIHNVQAQEKNIYNKSFRELISKALKTLMYSCMWKCALVEKGKV